MLELPVSSANDSVGVQLMPPKASCCETTQSRPARTDGQ